MEHHWNSVTGNAGDDEYNAFLDRVNGRFVLAASQLPIFLTDADDIWTKYLASFPLSEVQTHNCNACSHFIQRYAGLVCINPTTGETVSALWVPEDAPADYQSAVRAMKAAAEKARVVAPFYSSEQTLGHPKTGQWTHLFARNPKVYTPRKLGGDGKPLTAGQYREAKRQDYVILVQSLADFNEDVAQKAVDVLKAAALPRSERFLAPAEWFLGVHKARNAITGSLRNNIIWDAVAKAPEGWTHVRSSLIGSLMEDIVAGLAFDDIKKRFTKKVDPSFYQRAQAAPSGGQVAAAEKAVQELGIAPAFARRYTTLDDLNGFLWAPSAVIEQVVKTGSTEGVFDHLKPKAAALPELDIPAKRITFEKFMRDVLPGAASIDYRVPSVGRFCALTTAADPTAPPIVQWDSAESRNPVAWSFPSPAARAAQWNLTPGTLVPVQLIVKSPNQWGTNGEQAHEKGTFMLLQDAKDTRNVPGGGLFSEHLRGDLKPFRSTIEAHMNSMTVLGADDPKTQAFGIGYMAGGEFTEAAAPKAGKLPGVAGNSPSTVHVLLVIDDSGSMQHYIMAARRAVGRLLDAVRAMTGKVDVTAVKFGTRSSVLCRRSTVEHAVVMVTDFMNASSGNTALNDTVGDAITEAMAMSDAADFDTSFFLGIVTDGEENASRRYSTHGVAGLVRAVNETGRWTVVYAGGGRNPMAYARSIGIEEGNMTAFEASSAGFEDLGTLYATSTHSLADQYKSGQRSSKSFFAATSTHEALGKDYPVFVVTTKSGTRSAYEIDRWD